MRPLLPREEEQGAFDVVRVIDYNTLILEDPMEAYQGNQKIGKPRLPNLGRLGANSKEKLFSFDKIVGYSGSQESVFFDSLEPFLEDLLNGFNVTAFAYGPSGSGKTYSVLGT